MIFIGAGVVETPVVLATALCQSGALTFKPFVQGIQVVNYLLALAGALIRL